MATKIKKNQRKRAVIIDIDGTMANTDHRLPLLKGGNYTPEDWDKFIAAQLQDEPNKWCLEITKAMHKAGYKIIFITGRYYSEFGNTDGWLKKNLPKYMHNYILLMRTDTDKRPDYESKEQILKTIQDTYNILFAIDDKASVVKMFRQNGIECLECHRNVEYSKIFEKSVYGN
jgi:predicted secreted acid phosphatase